MKKRANYYWDITASGLEAYTVDETITLDQAKEALIQELEDLEFDSWQIPYKEAASEVIAEIRALDDTVSSWERTFNGSTYHIVRQPMSHFDTE